MIYIWRCDTCGEEAEIERVLLDIEMWPSSNEASCMCDSTWSRLIKGGQVMWNDARDKGVFPRTFKNYPELQ